MHRIVRAAAALTLVSALSACGGGGLEKQGPVAPTLDLSPLVDERAPYQRARFDTIASEFRALPGWESDKHAAVLPALIRTCDWVDTQAGQPDKPIGALPQAGKVSDWMGLCARIRSLPPGDHEVTRVFIETHFVPMSLGAGEEGLFTGYFEPTLRGSWTRGGAFQTPLYAPPPKNRRGQPSRAEIVNGALSGKGLELLYVDDPIDAFFLQIQGSGRVEMTDGTTVQLGYAAQNGHEYFPIGRYFIEQGAALPSDMSLQWLRRWLHAHPSQAAEIMNMNPSYVFFRRLNSGPRGTRNYILTPGRSLAVDHRLMSLGAPVWVDLNGTPLPGGGFRRLMVAQDTGGAIKGAVRGDVFWGHGPLAAEAAGFMRGRGRAWMLAIRPRTTQYLSELQPSELRLSELPLSESP